MSLKQFRVRDVVINLPIEIEPGKVADCAESPSVLSCIDGESLLKGFCSPPTPEKKPPQLFCWKGGYTIKGCPGTSVCGFLISEFPCEEGSPSGICNEKISPRVEIAQCDDAISWEECGDTHASLTPQTPIIDTVNTPVVFGKLGAARDLPAFRHELGQIMQTLDLHQMPRTEQEIDAVEKRLREALDQVVAQRQIKK